jgi:hypothetical protein
LTLTPNRTFCLFPLRFGVGSLAKRASRFAFRGYIHLPAAETRQGALTTSAIEALATALAR